MKEYEIEVSHTPSGQYFTMFVSFDEDWSEDSIIDHISNDINIAIISGNEED